MKYLPYLAVVIFTTLCLSYMMDYENEINSLQKQINHSNHMIDSLCNEIDSLNSIPTFKEKFINLLNVKATMYHPVESQCDDTPLITADGSIICPINVSDWNWIAVSQDLLKKNGGIFDYGDQVYVKGTHKDGVYTIRDCMNKRKTFQIDILESIGTSQYKYDQIEIFALND